MVPAIRRIRGLVEGPATSMADVRRCYGVPARRGARVFYTDSSGCRRAGRITSCMRGRGDRIRIVFDDGPLVSAWFHPTWNIEYDSSTETI